MSKQEGDSSTLAWHRAMPFASRLSIIARSLLAMTKPLQTSLLLTTGLCAYALSLPGTVRWDELALGGLALAGAISGCTALNMVLDRDIDSQMGRTARRPLPDRRISVLTATVFGLGLSAPALFLAWHLKPLFGLTVSLGFAADLGVYTLWLKRRTAFSILFGGISGGMPALAGRALALGQIDTVGILLASGVLLWIPAHILTLATHYADDYSMAGVPVWPNIYGARSTARLVAAATLGAAVVLVSAGFLIGIHPVAMGSLALMGTTLSALAIAGLIKPSESLNWKLFKAASLYMLGAFVCLTLGAVL